MLEIRELKYETDNDSERNEILNCVDIDIPSDSFVVITGPNGSGKSTLAKNIAGIYKPTSGKIVFDGTDITGMDVTQRAKLGISFAFQQPVKFKGIGVIDLLRLASGDHKLKASDCCEYLSEVGLCAKDYINREVDSSLSGGELKRIEIAMALARNTRLTIFDQPEAGIDLWSFSNLIRVFEKIKKSTKGTVIIISHQERILEIADIILVLDKGRIIKSGHPSEILPDILGTAAAVSPCRNSQRNKV